MREFLERYKIELETIGPIHIGSGETLRKREWILEWADQRAIVIDFDKFFQLLQRKQLLAGYESYVSAAGGDLLRWMKAHEISKKERYEIAKYTLDTKGLNLKNSRIHDMAMTMKDAYGLPYIPGSSLKGALRNAILALMLDRSNYNVSELKEEIRNYRGNSNHFLSRESSRLNQKYLYTKGISEKRADAVNDMMSGIRISDSNPVGLERLTLCQKIDAMPDGRTRDLPLVRECILPQSKFSFDMTIDRTETTITLSFIQEAVFRFLEDYNRLFLQHFPEKKQYKGQVLYLGGGTGFPTKTVLNQVLQNEPDRVRIVSDTLNKIFRNKHNEDIRKGISPRVAKLTDIDGELLQMGACGIDFAMV